MAEEEGRGMISHITLKLKSGETEELTMDEAKELYDELDVIFGKKPMSSEETLKELGDIFDKNKHEKTTWPQPYQPFNPLRPIGTGSPSDWPPGPYVTWCKSDAH